MRLFWFFMSPHSFRSFLDSFQGPIFHIPTLVPFKIPILIFWGGGGYFQGPAVYVTIFFGSFQECIFHILPLTPFKLRLLISPFSHFSRLVCSCICYCDHPRTRWMLHIFRAEMWGCGFLRNVDAHGVITKRATMCTGNISWKLPSSWIRRRVVW
jgi:hypothetical protein